MFQKLTAFTKKVAHLADKPTLNESDLKAQFDAAPEELRTYFNTLIDTLTSQTVGDSGAKNIGVNSISGLTGNDIQTLLENLNNTKAKNIQENWIEGVCQNGWVAMYNGYSYPNFKKDNFGLVHLKGTVRSGTVGPSYAIYTLPVGYRPSEMQSFSVVTSNGTNYLVGRVIVNPDGRVCLDTGANGVAVLDGITFFAEQ